MVPHIKVKVINKVKGLYGQQVNQTDLTGVLSKIDCTITDRFPSCSSLLQNLKVNLSRVKVLLGHMTVSCTISKFN